MKRAVLLPLVALTACTSDLAMLDLGDPMPKDATATRSLVMVAPAQIWPKHKWISAGIEYAIAADSRGRVQYIGTSSLQARTPEGVRIGQPLKDVLNIQNLEVTLWPGWGYVAELPSGWKAALFLDGHFLEREPLATDRVDLLFKGTLAGYGS